jgi:hypothetical protein
MISGASKHLRVRFHTKVSVNSHDRQIHCAAAPVRLTNPAQARSKPLPQRPKALPDIGWVQGKTATSDYRTSRAAALPFGSKP